MGHVVAADGIRPSSKKVDALRVAPRPTNMAELSSYLGLLKYDMNSCRIDAAMSTEHADTHLHMDWEQ